MKTIFIARHAKSSWEDFSVSDHDRDLLDIGIQRTLKVAAFLKKSGVIPEIIISSSAQRALKTARLLAENIGYPIENIKIDPSLYGCDEEDIFSLLYALPDEIHSVMVVGHNPAFTDFCNYLLKQKEQIDNLPTSGVVAFSVKTKHWSAIPDSKTKLLFKAFPRKMINDK